MSDEESKREKKFLKGFLSGGLSVGTGLSFLFGLVLYDKDAREATLKDIRDNSRPILTETPYKVLDQNGNIFSTSKIDTTAYIIDAKKLKP